MKNSVSVRVSFGATTLRPVSWMDPIVPDHPTVKSIRGTSALSVRHRLTSFKVPHSQEGLRELVERCSARRVGRGRGTVHFAFEVTGHVWEAVGAFFEQRALRYHVVNPLATFRVREARQMGRDKRDLTDAEQIAQLLRTGVVTKCQLLPARYMQLRRAWGEYQRLRCERARLKTLLVHQLYGVFPEIVGEWKTVTAPGRVV